MPSSAAAALADLFSKARLSLNVPSSSPSSSRAVAFFDEVLNVEAVLTLPSDPLLPVASSSTHPTLLSYRLPLPALPASTSLGHDAIPPYLAALLACLYVNLLTDYVPGQALSSTHLPKSTNPYEPLSTVQLQHQHLQLLPSHHPNADPAQAQHAAVRAFSNAWAGNQPPKPHRTLKDAADPQSYNPTKSSHDAHLTHDGQHWSVRWRCRVPINYIATPFSPLLSVTAALTLRLDPTLLEHLIPASSPSAFLRSGFAHSLLAPLHEGPIYPDESPLQSQARAKASSTLGLDGPSGLGSYLAHLSKDVVGGNNTVVTPRSGAHALDAIHKRRSQIPAADAPLNKSLSKPDSNGDLAALSSGPKSSSDLTRTPSSQRTATPSQLDSDNHLHGLQIYKRSTRLLLPLKTGLNVRMRTLITQHDPYIHRRPTLPQPNADLDSTRLVLSVELENPFESDSAFVVNDIQIKIDDAQSDQHNSHCVIAKPLQPMPSVLPIRLTRGSQHNMLFYVSVESDHALHRQFSLLDQRELSARNVTITVSGRPIGEQEEHMADFDSQWNCALDLTPVLSDAAKKLVVAGGSATGRLVQSTAGPVAGNVQYSASSLRTAAQHQGRYSTGPLAPPRIDHADDTRTPRPGQLGMGFPPPLRTSSVRQFSTATVASTVQLQPDATKTPSQPATPTSFLDKAKARALNRQSASQLDAADHPAAVNIKPWSSSSNAMIEVAAGGLLVLSTLRRAGGINVNGGRDKAEGDVKMESSLGDDGTVRPSDSIGTKTLHPTSIRPSNVEEKAARFQAGDTVILDLTILYKSSPSAVTDHEDAITDISLSWASSATKLIDTTTVNNRDSIGASSDLARTRLIDADSARLKSFLLLSQAELLNGLIPIQDHLVLNTPLLPQQSRTVALSLRCLSPGSHAIPPLQLNFTSASAGRSYCVLDGLGRVCVTPAAVL
ncbi:hypothetical protein EX895_005441 [Sporisorium graminicola]|uniref:Uncharacterized protein n=1 Tax=Sporisorium graminicola TaxID=280036 RepID=A0A4U7KNH6_9BASI|nr:hypothetical protein EX895_005441 [Sporisorium graminicola]TKY85900.1 hypothetical protein EX895_005441 [Sporisorium graminicola]